MTIQFAAPAVGRAVSLRAETFIAEHVFDRPTLVLDTEQVGRNYRALATGLSGARLHYAVKANPAPQVIARLVDEGCAFDAASRAEIALCLEQGAEPKDISFGNTIKKVSDIAYAYAAGVRLFAADAEEELDKIADAAPGAQVYIRVLVMNSEADWPLSRKFGCAPEKVAPLMARAQVLGLKPVGISFHVGSQTRKPEMWDGPLGVMGALWHDLAAQGFALDLLNIGGGFPCDYDGSVADPTSYGAGVMALVRKHFGTVARVMAEPGRGMVADAGAIATEVLLVAQKSETDLCRWVYLDIGRFSGLAETEG